jgi:hypothetical protein
MEGLITRVSWPTGGGGGVRGGAEKILLSNFRQKINPRDRSRYRKEGSTLAVSRLMEFLLFIEILLGERNVYLEIFLYKITPVPVYVHFFFVVLTYKQ